MNLFITYERIIIKSLLVRRTVSQKCSINRLHCSTKNMRTRMPKCLFSNIWREIKKFQLTITFKRSVESNYNLWLIFRYFTIFCFTLCYLIKKMRVLFGISYFCNKYIFCKIFRNFFGYLQWSGDKRCSFHNFTIWQNNFNWVFLLRVNFSLLYY